MANYYYDVYNRQPVYGHSAWEWLQTTVTTTPFTGGANLYVESIDTWYMIGSATASPNTSILAYTFSGTTGIYRTFQGTPDQLAEYTCIIVLDYYIQGTYINTIVAEDGTYPDDGISGSYWYVKGALVFPSMGIKVDGVLKTSVDGWVKIDGVLRHVDSIWANINGVLKKL